MPAPSVTKSKILVVDDEALIRQELRRWFERCGYAVAEAGTVAEARTKRPASFDLLLCDLRLPDEDGTALLERNAGTPVVIMTSYGTVRSAVDAMKQGAADYVTKPFDSDELLETVRRVLSSKRHAGSTSRQAGARRSNGKEPSLGAFAPSPGTADTEMIGQSAALKDLALRLRKVAPTPATVLILGESGTGKELVARSLHHHSQRHAGPFVAVNCAAIPDALFESELFGHERGAFTGATQAHVGLVQSADGGTLFLDEVGELPLSAQARMLRWLQQSEIRRVGSNRSKRVDTRLVAATHRDLPKMIAAGTFREDLYFRLRVVQLRIAPLRERPEDIMPLAEHLLGKCSRQLGRSGLRFAADVPAELHSYHWPGNVRELQNAIERAAILSEGSCVHASALGLRELRREAGQAGSGGPGETSVEAYVRRFVLENQRVLSDTEIARRLGMSRKALWERRRRMGIPRPKSV